MRLVSVVLLTLLLLATGVGYADAAATISAEMKVEMVLRDRLVLGSEHEWIVELLTALGVEILDESVELPGWHYADYPEGWTVTGERLGESAGTRLDYRNSYGYTVLSILVGPTYEWPSDQWRYESWADVQPMVPMSPTQEALGLVIPESMYSWLRVRFVVIDKKYDTMVYETEYRDVQLGDYASIYASYYCECGEEGCSGPVAWLSEPEVVELLLADQEAALNYARTPPEGISMTWMWWLVD